MNSAKPRSRFARTARWLLVPLVGYVGILVLLVAMESKFVYGPLTAQQSWKPLRSQNLQEVTLKSSTGDQIHCWWLSKSDAKTAMIYSHGNGGNLSYWGRSMVRWRDALETSVLIYDYPGFGHSTGEPDEATCYASAEAAWQWLTQEQGMAPEKITLVGESLGGAMAVELASRHPCRALVVLKSLTSIPDMASAKFPWLPARYFVRHQYDNLAKIRNFRGPLFIYHGERDQVIPFDHGRALFQTAPGPKALFADPDGDHFTAWPHDFFPRVQAFLRQHVPE